MTPDDLVEIELIKRLKYKYARCLDQKLWDEIAECFTADAHAAYSGGGYSFDGRDAIVDFLSRSMGAETFHSSHKMHHPEIDLTGPDTAHGVWALDDVVVMTDFELTIRGCSFYDDEYVKQDGAWRIQHTGYKRVFEEMQPRGNVEGLRLTASWWATGGRSELPGRLNRGSVSPTAAEVRAGLGHPVIDADGHGIEYLPWFRDLLRDEGGPGAVDAWDVVENGARLTRAPRRRHQARARRLPRARGGACPTENTLDRATAMLPALLHERLDELGIDVAVCYPTYGLTVMGLDDPHLRVAAARAFNTYYAQAYAGLRDRLEPVAIVPTYAPDEAIAVLDHAVETLGLRAVMCTGLVHRPLPGENLPAAPVGSTRSGSTARTTTTRSGAASSSST